MTTGTDTREALHLVTQDGQPYGSERRCCEECGRMCWRGMAGSQKRWTDDREAWRAAPDRCEPLPSTGVYS